MEKKLNLKNDIIFKEFFSRKGNEKFLKDFLNALLQINIEKIEIQRDVSLERLSVEEKLGILDIQAVLDDKTVVSIEMQMRDEKDMIRRSSFYAAKGLSSGMKKGEAYKTFKNIIMVNILNFNINQYEEYVSKGINVLEAHREHELDTGVYYYYIELPKFRKSKPNLEEKLDQWLAFIDNEEGRLVEMAKEKNKVIKEAEEELEYLTGDEEVKRMAFLHEKWEHDYVSGMENAREEGEEKSKKEIAKKMKEKNIPVETIIEVTELTKDEINKL